MTAFAVPPLIPPESETPPLVVNMKKLFIGSTGKLPPNSVGLEVLPEKACGPKSDHRNSFPPTVAWTSNKPPESSVKKKIRDNGSVVVVPENPTVSGAVTAKKPPLENKGAGASGKLNDSEKAELGELRGETGTSPAYVPLIRKSIVSACVTGQPKASNISRKPTVDDTLRMALSPFIPVVGAISLPIVALISNGLTEPLHRERQYFAHLEKLPSGWTAMHVGEAALVQFGFA